MRPERIKRELTPAHREEYLRLRDKLAGEKGEILAMARQHKQAHDDTNLASEGESILECLMTAESPDHVRISHAAAMTLGLEGGRFWRGAKLTCINLLLVYEDGCTANCAYCGLARERGGSESFIRVAWPVFPVATIAERVKSCPDAHRVCISMITRPRAVADSIAIASAIRAECDVPISGLISPTVVRKDDLVALKEAGIDKIGIALDAATELVFDRLRGRQARGPHRWDRYWGCFAEAVEIFGQGQAGSHLIVGLGETEKEMVEALQRVHDLGGVNHLFSFYPEADTALEDEVPPPMEQYRRIQLAAEIIDRGLASLGDFGFDDTTGEIGHFGISANELERLIDEGTAFMTRGCVGRSGDVACNRPFANSAAGPGLRNYPFQPNAEDIALIRRQLAGDWTEPLPVIPAGRSPKGVRKNPRKVGRIHFHAPTIKHFETDEFANSSDPVFVPISITGEACALDCKFCEGDLLKGMYTAKTPEVLWDLAERLKGRGCKGFLLSGGCNRDGIVPVAPFAPALKRVKAELGLRTAVHTKLLDEPLAKALCEADLDVVMVDVVGSDDTMREIYNLPHRTVQDVRQTLDLSDQYGLPLSPHIVLGAHAGEFRGEFEALDMLRGRKLKSLVIVLLMPLPGKKPPAPEPSTVCDFFKQARRRFPDTPLLLGCARPMGKIQREIDMAAIEAGFDGITYPAEGTVTKAREMGLRPVFSELCCALMV